MNRRTIRRFTLVSTLAMSLPLAALAQRGPAANDDGTGCAHAQRTSFEGHPGHEGRFHGRDVRGGHFMRGLDLTEAQRDQLFTLRHAQAPKMRELGKTLRHARQELRQLSMSDNYDEARAKALADSASQAGAEMAMLRAQMGNQMYRILTPEQREKLKQRTERRGGGGPGAEERG